MLTQQEADALIAAKKELPVGTPAVAIAPGADETHELAEVGGDERFLLDLSRGRRRVAKLKFQTRARKVVVLLRLDLDGSPHTNPDGTLLDGTHLHVFREGYEDKWAYPLDPERFADPLDAPHSFADFCDLSNIASAPILQETLL